jgi:hypothetical protein
MRQLFNLFLSLSAFEFLAAIAAAILMAIWLSYW